MNLQNHYQTLVAKRLTLEQLLSRQLSAAFPADYLRADGPAGRLNVSSVSWGFPPGPVSWLRPENLQREGKSSGFSSAEYHSMEKRGSFQITYCCLRAFQSRSRSSEAWRTLSQNSRDATLMSQSWRLSGPHLRRLHPVHRYHEQQRQQGVPMWESSAHADPAWCDAKTVNIALAPHALTMCSSQ